MSNKNVGFSKFWNNTKNFFKKSIKCIDKSVKSVLGITIYTLVLGVISSFLIFNLGSVVSSTIYNTTEDIALSITKTDSYDTSVVKADVNYDTALGAGYSFRNWNTPSSNKQSMFVDGKDIYVVDGYNKSGYVVITKYDSHFKKKSTNKIEISKYGNKVFKKYGWDTTFLYGNFYMADDYYYLALVGPDYGSQALNTTKLSAPAIRIIKLNKFFWKVDTFDVSYAQMSSAGANGATRPAGWSNIAMAVSPDGSELILSTGFDGYYDSYASGVGTGSRHQTGYQLILDTKTMQQKKKNLIWVTHTLGQHVLYDGSNRIFIDAADASPVHGLLLSKVSGSNYSTTRNIQVKTPTIASYVYMNMNIGGVVASNKNYLTVYNTMDETLNSSNGASHNTVSTEIRDIRVLITPKDNVSNGTIVTLYDYISTKETPLTQNENTRTGGEPTITAIDDNNFLVMWHECTYIGGESFSYKTTCYMIIDENGNVVQDVIRDNTMWLNTWSKPVYSEKNDTVYWFNDKKDNTRTFYSLKVRV